MKLRQTGVLLASLMLSGVAFAGNGEAVYNKSCQMCHGSGMAGAPKTGDKAAWSQRIAGGMDLMVQNAIKGKMGKAGMMPPRGGNPNLSDQDVKDAVKFMVAKSQ